MSFHLNYGIREAFLTKVSLKPEKFELPNEEQMQTFDLKYGIKEAFFPNFMHILLTKRELLCMYSSRS